MNPDSVVVIDFPIFSWLINSVVRVAQPELTAYQQIWDQRPQGDRFSRFQSCLTNADVMSTSCREGFLWKHDLAYCWLF